MGSARKWFAELRRRNVARVGIAYAVAAWVMLQVATTLAQALTLPGWTTRLVTVLLALGFPIALVLAWVYEITPNGVRRDVGVAAEASRRGTRAAAAEVVRYRRLHRIDRAIIGVLVLGLVVLGWRSWTAEPTATTAPTPATPASAAPRVAVLPFASLADGADDAHFADGLSEEILNRLARIEGLGVIGRTSSFAYRGRPQDLRAMGQELGATHILEGSVRRQGRDLRITAQLIGTTDGLQLWSERFARTLDDLFAVQDEIAAAVARQLELRLKPMRRDGGSRDVDAAALFLQAMGARNSWSPAALRDALRHVEAALARDPDFADALALRGMLEIDRYHFGDLLQSEALDRAAPFLERALSLAPGSAFVRSANGRFASYSDAISPDPKWRELAVTELEAALALNPGDALTMVRLSGELTTRHPPDHERILALARRALAIDPNLTGARFRLAVVAHTAGRREERDRALSRMEEGGPSERLSAAVLRGLVGDLERAHRGLVAAIRTGVDTTAFLELARIYWMLRADDLALAVLDATPALDAANRFEATFFARAGRGEYGAVVDLLLSHASDPRQLPPHLVGALGCYEENGDGDPRARDLVDRVAAEYPAGWPPDHQLDWRIAFPIRLLERRGEHGQVRALRARLLEQRTAMPDLLGTDRVGAVELALQLGDLERARWHLVRAQADGVREERELTACYFGPPKRRRDDPLLGDPVIRDGLLQLRARNAATLERIRASGLPLVPAWPVGAEAARYEPDAT